MSARILVINPNSSATVTDGIARALDGFRSDGGPAIDCLTLAEGPPGIETQRHVDEVVAPLCRAIEQESARMPSSSPASPTPASMPRGRRRTRRSSALRNAVMLAALARGERFGIVAILEGSIPRHRRYVASLGLSARMAGERAIGLGVTQLAQEDIVADRMTAMAERLRDEDGADVIVLGCAGMARYRARLEAHLGCPVIDPSQPRSAWRSRCCVSAPELCA